MKKLLLVALLLPSLACADGLPNAKLTAGALNPNVTTGNIKSTICVPNYTATIRPSSYYTNKLKLKQIKEYGYVDKDPKHYEEDHLIPLSVGGATSDPANLWPEPRYGVNHAAKKDVLEAWAHRAVCKGTLNLKVAQDMFATDWVAGYNKYIRK
jgi:hypothetical protein